METIEGNILIAKFMGGIKSKIDGPGKWIRFPEPHAGTETFSFWPKQLKYHSSWDWLMPVVKKIQQLPISEFSNKKPIMDALMDVEIELLWRSVIVFIQWYNLNNPQTSYKMTPLTPQQRIEAYTEALRTIKKSPRECFMCPELRNWSSGVTPDDYDEFVLFKPSHYKFVWFNTDAQGNKTREIILLFCIEIAKDSIN